MNNSPKAAAICAVLLLSLGCGKSGTDVVVGPTPSSTVAPKVSMLADGTAEASFQFVDKTPCAACVRAVNTAMTPLGPAFKSHDLAPGETKFKVRFDPRLVDAAKLATALAAAEPAIQPQG